MDQDLTDLRTLGSAGDRARELALQSIYNRNARRYLAFLCNRGATLSDAEDILHEFCSRLWTSRADLRSVQNASAYLWQALRTASIDYFRKHDKLPIAAASDSSDALDEALRNKGIDKHRDELTDIERHDLSSCLERALAAFEKDCPDRSDVISLVVIEGWSQSNWLNIWDEPMGQPVNFFLSLVSVFAPIFGEYVPSSKR